MIEITHWRYVSVPARLTRPIEPPPPPAKHCRFEHRPAVCVLDALIWIKPLQGKLQQANTDRATTATLGAAPDHD